MTHLSIPVLGIHETPRRVQLRADQAWWNQNARGAEAESERLLEPFVLELDTYSVGRRLLFRGEVIGRVELQCGRCMEPYEYRLREPVSLLLEPLPTGSDVPEGGIELDPEDLELGRYAGEELDFGPVLLETLLTSWPMQPRCSEGCRGLCPVCGANRNRAPCACEAREGNRPFEVLGELLGQGRGTSKEPRD